MSFASRRVHVEPALMIIGVFLPNRGDKKISGCIDSLTFSHQSGLPTGVLFLFSEISSVSVIVSFTFGRF